MKNCGVMSTGTDPAWRVIPITDSDDPRVAIFSRLKVWHSGDERGGGGRPDPATFIAEGRLVGRRLIDSGIPVTAMLVRDTLVQEALSWGGGFPLYTMSEALIARVVGYDFHRGFLVAGIRPTALTTAALVARRPATALCLDDVTDPENIGTMLRTAAAMGVWDVVLGPRTLDPYSRRITRVSMGTLFGQRFYRVDDLAATMSSLARRHGYRILASTLADDSVDLSGIATDDRPLVLVMGSEGQGVSPAVQAAATDRVRIGMPAGVDSLNVSAAAAIFLYTLRRPQSPDQ